MSKDYQKGRADAAKGVYDPPGPHFGDSKEQRERALQRKEEYREGYHDKRREMGKA